MRLLIVTLVFLSGCEDESYPISPDVVEEPVSYHEEHTEEIREPIIDPSNPYLVKPEYNPFDPFPEPRFPKEIVCPQSAQAITYNGAYTSIKFLCM